MSSQAFWSSPVHALFLDVPADESRFKRYCCWWKRLSNMTLYLIFSVVTLLIGLSLFWVSMRQNRTVDLGPRNFGVPEMRAYWLELGKVLVQPDDIVIPATPAYKALQWMVLHDPLRPLTDLTHMRQRFTVTFLYFWWAGPSWGLPEHAGWLQDAAKNKTLVHECSWEGIQCNAEKQIIALELDNEIFGIKGGRIPPQLGDLTGLQSLALVGHDLKGSVPSELAKLKAIQSIDLGTNRLTSIDLASMSVSDLHLLRLSDNKIKGFLDFAQLGQATNLKTMEINNNDYLDGAVFTYLSNWTRLESLNLAATALGGSLPQDLGKLTNLKEINLESMFLSTLPTSIGDCQSLETMRVKAPPGGEFGLEGGLPTEIGLLTNLRLLDIRRSRRLASTLPTELGRLTLLDELNLVDNQHTGPLPSELGNLGKARRISFEGNHISGTVPTEFGKLSSVEVLVLVGNHINGTMPQEVCDLQTEVNAPCRRFDQGQEQVGRFQCECCRCF